MPLDHSGMNIINQFTSCLEQQQCHKRSKTSRSVKRDDEGTRAFVCVRVWGGWGVGRGYDGDVLTLKWGQTRLSMGGLEVSSDLAHCKG